MGCALGEFYNYTNPEKYVGIDINVLPDGKRKILQGDYRKVENFGELLKDYNPTAFVSLFSTEITAPAVENHTLYEKIFQEVSSIQSGLVSGFYY